MKFKNKDPLSKVRSSERAGEKREKKKLRKEKEEQEQLKAKKKKKRIDDDVTDVEPKVKKKKKPGTDLVVVSSKDKKLTKVKKVKDQALKSFFGESAGKIMDMLELNDSDGAISLLKKKLLQTTVDVLPFAEDILRGSGTSKGTYQFVTLISTIRELIADIQADQDRKYLARSVMANILQPAFMEIAQNMLTEHHEFKKVHEDMIRSDKVQPFNVAMTELARRLAVNANGVYRQVESKMEEALKV